MKFLLLVLLLILSAYSVDNNMEMAKEAYLKKDYSRAFSLYKTEAESGDEKAQYNIGYMYSQGLGIDKDFKRALEYTELSAKQSYPPALWNMSVYYAQGEVVPINPEISYRYLEKAASLKEENAVNFKKKLEEKKKKANLIKNECSNECVLTYMLANIEVSDKTITYWENKGLSENDIKLFLSKGVKNPEDMISWISTMEDKYKILDYLDKGYTNPEKAVFMEKIKIYSYVGIVLLIILGIILGAGEKRKIVVFKNYDDLGLSFLVPISYILIMILIPMGAIYLNIKSNELNDITQIIALGVSGLILLKVIINTFKSNTNIFKAILAVLVKFPLSLLWVFSLMEIINPSGKTHEERRKNRSGSLLILTFLTPVVVSLVEEKTGIFSPRKLLKGKRVGTGIRDHL